MFLCFVDNILMMAWELLSLDRILSYKKVERKLIKSWTEITFFMTGALIYQITFLLLVLFIIFYGFRSIGRKKSGRTRRP